MDLSYNSELKRQCFKCPPTVINSLNLFYVPTNATLILWNKFQIFIYENLEFATPIKTIIPEFQLRHLIISNNYLLSLDYSGNIHLLSLKFKSVQNKIKFCFIPKEQRVMSFTLFSDNLIVSLKSELRSYYLYIHRIGTEFLLEKKILLFLENEVLPVPNDNKCIFKCYNLTEEEVTTLQTRYFTKKVHNSKDTKLIILSIDKLNIFYCLLNSKMAEHELSLNKLYTCPSEISDIEITRSEQTYLIIGLTIGTFIKLDLQDLKNPIIIHLNTAISQFKAFNNTMLYSDGISLWKNEINNDDLVFRQFFVKQIKDFIKINDRIICTTFMNMIYTFSINDEESYLKSEFDSEYCPAEKLFSNYEYLNKIMEEIKKNEGIIKKLSIQKDYITALALSNRQDIMENIIYQTVLVFENYNDAILEHPDLHLTNEYSDYFVSNSIFFLVNITTSDDKLTNILPSSLDLTLHVTITANKVLKTISIKVTEKLNKKCFLIPLKENLLNTEELHIHLKFMASIPGALDLKKKIWSILYRKTVILKLEHFIKTNVANKVLCLKEPETTLSEQIIQATQKLYGNLFDFMDIFHSKPSSREWNMYVRLPINYQDALKNLDLIQTHLNKQKTKFLLQQLTTDEFLKSKNSISWTINNEKVRLEVENDGFSNPVVKVMCSNLKVALNIREFISDLYYNDKLSQGREFVNHSFYITVENLKKSIRDCLSSSSQEVLPLIEQFERNVMGVIPV